MVMKLTKYGSDLECGWSIYSDEYGIGLPVYVHKNHKTSVFLV